MQQVLGESEKHESFHDTMELEDQEDGDKDAISSPQGVALFEQCEGRGIGTTWNRDVNASRNIMRMGIYNVFDVERPSIFRRKTKKILISSRGKVLCANTDVEEKSGMSNLVIQGASTDARSEKSSTSTEMQFMTTLLWDIMPTANLVTGRGVPQ